MTSFQAGLMKASPAGAREPVAPKFKTPTVEDTLERILEVPVADSRPRRESIQLVRLMEIFGARMANIPSVLRPCQVAHWQPRCLSCRHFMSIGRRRILECVRSQQCFIAAVDHCSAWLEGWVQQHIDADEVVLMTRGQRDTGDQRSAIDMVFLPCETAAYREVFYYVYNRLPASQQHTSFLGLLVAGPGLAREDALTLPSSIGDMLVSPPQPERPRGHGRGTDDRQSRRPGVEQPPRRRGDSPPWLPRADRDSGGPVERRESDSDRVGAKPRDIKRARSAGSALDEAVRSHLDLPSPSRAAAQHHATGPSAAAGGYRQSVGGDQSYSPSSSPPYTPLAAHADYWNDHRYRSEDEAAVDDFLTTLQAPAASTTANGGRRR